MAKVTMRIAISKKNFRLGLIALGVLAAWLVVLSGLILATADASADKEHFGTRDTRGGTGFHIELPNKHGSAGANDGAYGRGVSRKMVVNYPCVQASAACSSEDHDLHFEGSSGNGSGIMSNGTGDSNSGGSSSPSGGLYNGVFAGGEFSTFGQVLPLPNGFGGTGGEPTVNEGLSTGGGSQGDGSQTSGDGSTPSDPGNPNPFVRRLTEPDPLGGPNGPPLLIDNFIPQAAPDASPTQPIPEPWTFAIFVFGFAAIAMTRRRVWKRA